MIRVFSAQDTLAAALIENLQREDLNPMEEALGLQALKEEFGLSQDDMAQKIGKSRSAIANSLRLLALPESMQALVADGRLSAGHARALLSVNDPKAQEYLKNVILENKLSVREAEGLAAGWKESGSFAIGGLGLAEAGGSSPTSGAEETAGSEKEAEEDAAKLPAAEKKEKPQSARMLEIQSAIAQLLNVPVRVTGKDSKGKITLSFSSREELENLIQRLSTMALEGNGLDALPSRPMNALEARTMNSLESSSAEALPADDKPKLGHSAREALHARSASELPGRSEEALTAPDRMALSGTSRQALGEREMDILEGPDRQALSSAEQKALEDAAKEPDMDAPSSDGETS